jgi:hypothetical protein
MTLTGRSAKDLRYRCGLRYRLASAYCFFTAAGSSGGNFHPGHGFAAGVVFGFVAGVVFGFATGVPSAFASNSGSRYLFFLFLYISSLSLPVASESVSDNGIGVPGRRGPPTNLASGNTSSNRTTFSSATFSSSTDGALDTSHPTSVLHCRLRYSC